MAQQSIPKIIHICWFGDGKYPVEVKACMDSWKRILPDYEVRIWNHDDAVSLGIPFVDEALHEQKWAFAADVVRFYAVLTEGGVYMDSDIFLYKRFDEIIGRNDDFITFHEKCDPEHENFGLQAAMFMGVKGNEFCREMVEYYRGEHFLNPDGSFNMKISPERMREVAQRHGYVSNDVEQNLDIMSVLPTRYLKPRKRYPRTDDCFGEHRVVGSWRKRPLMRRMTKRLEHWWRVVRYNLFKR